MWSFISLRLLLPVIRGWLAGEADLVALVKPQFEAGRRQVGKGGVVRDPAVHREVLRQLTAFAASQGLAVGGLLRSAVAGPGPATSSFSAGCALALPCPTRAPKTWRR